MRDNLEQNVVVPKRTACDLAARYSFCLTIAPLLIGYLILQLVDIEEVVFYCVFICEVIGLLLGVVSLFGNRMQPISFLLALVGIVAGGIIGFICFSWMKHGIGGSFG